LFGGQSISSPAFRINTHVIAGATYMTLTHDPAADFEPLYLVSSIRDLRKEDVAANNFKALASSISSHRP
jgi:hypothetical protein